MGKSHRDISWGLFGFGISDRVCVSNCLFLFLFDFGGELRSEGQRETGFGYALERLTDSCEAR